MRTTLRDDGWTITISWFTWAAIVMLGFCAFWDSIFFPRAIDALHGNNYPIGAVPHLLAGVAITYWTLSRLFNQTRITMHAPWLKVRQGPVPWPGNTTTPTSQLKGVRIERRGPTDTPSIYAVVAELANGERTDVVKLQEAEHAEFVLAMLRRSLVKPDAGKPYRVASDADAEQPIIGVALGRPSTGLLRTIALCATLAVVAWQLNKRPLLPDRRSAAVAAGTHHSSRMGLSIRFGPGWELLPPRHVGIETMRYEYYRRRAPDPAALILSTTTARAISDAELPGVMSTIQVDLLARYRARMIGGPMPEHPAPVTQGCDVLSSPTRGMRCRGTLMNNHGSRRFVAYLVVRGDRAIGLLLVVPGHMHRDVAEAQARNMVDSLE